MNDSVLCISNNNSNLRGTLTLKVFFVQFLSRFYINYGTRKQLINLDEHLLLDIGISCAEAHNEAKKVFWK